MGLYQDWMASIKWCSISGLRMDWMAWSLVGTMDAEWLHE